jgi:hypothetical protein
MVFGLLITVLGLGTVCALLYYCAVFALPVFIGLSAAFWAVNAGAGVGCVFVGLAAGVIVFVSGQLVFSCSRSLAVRLKIVLLFALPASVAGYSLVLQLAELGVPSIAWRHVMAVIGAALIGFAGLRKFGRSSNEIASGLRSS